MSPLILFVCIFVTSVASTNVRQCSKNRPYPLSVVIEGCETMPCDVIKGTTAHMKVHFVGIRDDTKSISTEVRATIFGLTVHYELPEEVADVCANLMYGARCPIDNSEDDTYSFKFPIDSYYPEISVKVEVSLVDDSTHDTIACFIADIKVKKGNSGTRLI